MQALGERRAGILSTNRFRDLVRRERDLPAEPHSRHKCDLTHDASGSASGRRVPSGLLLHQMLRVQEPGLN
jgi:hypothetical protein